MFCTPLDCHLLEGSTHCFVIHSPLRAWSNAYCIFLFLKCLCMLWVEQTIEWIEAPIYNTWWSVCYSPWRGCQSREQITTAVTSAQPRFPLCQGIWHCGIECKKKKNICDSKIAHFQLYELGSKNRAEEIQIWTSQSYLIFSLDRNVDW